MKQILIMAVFFFILPGWVHAQHKSRLKATGKDSSKHKQQIPYFNARPVITHHSILVRGKTLRYTATTGYLKMRDYQGKVNAYIFFIAYTLDGVPPDSRPVTFAFNGGPGSSSIWLHMGALGPEKVSLDQNGLAPAPPYHLQTNQDTWLDKTDLVFIDPVSTGYSRPAPGQNADQFHGYYEDINSVGAFIKLWTTKYDRWGSPKFILGESYGTTRAAGLAGYMQDHYGMYLNGIILLSSVLNFQTISFTPGNEWPYVFFLPSYATTAWYYKKLSPAMESKTVEQVAREAEAFAGGRYASALLQGDRLKKTEIDSIASALHHFTSMPVDYILRSGLRIKDGQFFQRLLYTEGKVIGRYDSRFSGDDMDKVSEYAGYDPSYTNLNGIFTATFNEYVRDNLDYKNNLNYETLTNVSPWDYRNVENRYLDVATTLHRAMITNPYLHVWVACGYYDLATPFFNAEYVVHHMALRPDQEQRLQVTYYPAGHMLYIGKTPDAKLHSDAVSFYDHVLNQ